MAPPIDRHHDGCRLRGDRRIGVVVERHAARHAENADIMPRERQHDHADEPGPELRPHQAETVQRATGQMRPHVIGDDEIHDDDGAAEDQMEMPGDPLRIMDRAVELIAHVDEAAGAAKASMTKENARASMTGLRHGNAVSQPSAPLPPRSRAGDLDRGADGEHGQQRR